MFFDVLKCFKTRDRRGRAQSIRIFYADVAQLVELLICNQQVGGSSPSIGSNLKS